MRPVPNSHMIQENIKKGGRVREEEMEGEKEIFIWICLS